MAAPLATLIARQLSLTWKSSLFVGVLVLVLPFDVLESHAAKSDAAAATAIMLLAWSILRKVDDPDAMRLDAQTGLAVALALGSKQTALFLAISLVAGLIAILRWQRFLSWARIVSALMVMAAAATLAWIPMNIGIILDFKSFLEYQAQIRQFFCLGRTLASQSRRPALYP